MFAMMNFNFTQQTIYFSFDKCWLTLPQILPFLESQPGEGKLPD